MSVFKKREIYRNKYVIVLAVFLVYLLLLGSADILTIINQRRKLKDLREKRRELTLKYEETKAIVNQLDTNNEALERYARENKFFKRDNEDIFVIVEE